MNKIFNSAKQQQYGEGKNKLLEEYAKRQNQTGKPKAEEGNKIVDDIKKNGLYEKLTDRYKANNFRTGRSVEELAKDNKYINKPLNEIRQDYQEISEKLKYENNYTDPEKRNHNQIKKDELVRDKISFALDYKIYKENANNSISKYNSMFNE